MHPRCTGKGTSGLDPGWHPGWETLAHKPIPELVQGTLLKGQWTNWQPSAKNYSGLDSMPGCVCRSVADDPALSLTRFHGDSWCCV